jgi:hypothetical protein
VDRTCCTSSAAPDCGGTPGSRPSLAGSWWRTPSAVRPVDIGEVAAVERIPVADLTDPTNRLMVRMPSGRASPAFRVGSLLIWGFTAALTARLLELAGWEQPWDASRVRELPEGA